MKKLTIIHQAPSPEAVNHVVAVAAVVGAVAAVAAVLGVGVTCRRRRRRRMEGLVPLKHGEIEKSSR